MTAASLDASLPCGSMWRIRGVDLHVRPIGPQDAPALLIVHGGPGANHKKLLPLSVFSSKFRVVFYDQRGTGDSARLHVDPKSPETLKKLSLEENVLDIDALRQALGQETMSVLGHSWGGALATFYAAEFPQHVNRLIVSSGGPEDLNLWEEKERNHSKKRTPEENELLQQKAKQLEAAVKDGADHTILDRLFAEAIRIAYPSLYFRRPERIPELGRMGFWANAVVGQYCETFDRNEFAEKLRQITCPSLLLWGRHEPSPQERLIYLERHLPNARLVVFENSGHNAIEEEPERFFQVISDFLLQ